MNSTPYLQNIKWTYIILHQWWVWTQII